MNKRAVVLCLVLVAAGSTAFLIPMGWLFLTGYQGEKWKYAVPGTVNSVAVSRNGSYLVAGSESSLTTGSVHYLSRTGVEVWRRDFDVAIFTVSISSNASYVAAAGSQLLGQAGVYSNSMVHFLDSQGNLLWSYAASSPVFALTITPDSHLAVRTSDELLYFDNKGALQWSYPIGQSATSTISSNGTVVAVGGSRKIYLFSSDGAILWSFPIEDTAVGPVEISSDGSYVVAGSSTSGTNGTLYLLDNQGNLQWKRHIDSNVLSVSSDGKHVVAGTNWWILMYTMDGSLLWSRDYPNAKVKFSPDGANVVAGLWADFGPSLLVLDLDGRAAQGYKVGLVHSFSVSDDGTLVVATGPSVTGPFSQSSGAVYLFIP